MESAGRSRSYYSSFTCSLAVCFLSLVSGAGVRRSDHGGFKIFNLAESFLSKGIIVMN